MGKDASSGMKVVEHVTFDIVSIDLYLGEAIGWIKILG